MRAKHYQYKGADYTLTQLAKISPVSGRTIQKRIDAGWSVESAVETPFTITGEELIPQEYRDKVLEIRFSEPIGTVFGSMQPRLDRSYIARPSPPSRNHNKTRLYYVMELEPGRPLIVYPGEFEIVRAVN